MLKAYLDDSGDEDLHAVSVAGAIGTADDWSNFTDDWTHVLRAFSVPALHMTDMVASRRSFSCWHVTDPRKTGFLECLLGLMAQHRLEPLGRSLPLDAWQAVSEHTRAGQAGRAYYACLQQTLHEVTLAAASREQPVSVIIARKDKHIGIAEALIAGIRKHSPLGQTLAPPSLRSTPREVPALQVGDFVAWEMHRSYTDTQPGSRIRWSLQRLLALAPPGALVRLTPEDIPSEDD